MIQDDVDNQMEIYEWNMKYISASIPINYSDVKWAPRYLNSPASQLFGQQFV